MTPDEGQMPRGGHDWEQFLRAHDAGAEIALGDLRPGDLLVVETNGARYELRMQSEREAVLQTSRDDRPSGRVVIQGCTFGASSSIKPDGLFCGGNLEFTFSGGEMVHRTTAIRALRVVQVRRAGDGKT